MKGLDGTYSIVLRIAATDCLVIVALQGLEPRKPLESLHVRSAFYQKITQVWNSTSWSSSQLLISSTYYSSQ